MLNYTYTNCTTYSRHVETLSGAITLASPAISHQCPQGCSQCLHKFAKICHDCLSNLSRSQKVGFLLEEARRKGISKEIMRSSGGEKEHHQSESSRFAACELTSAIHRDKND